MKVFALAIGIYVIATATNLDTHWWLEMLVAVAGGALVGLYVAMSDRK